jgi:hypothetical protein
MSDLDRISKGVQDAAVRAALARIVEVLEDLIARIEALEP